MWQQKCPYICMDQNISDFNRTYTIWILIVVHCNGTFGTTYEIHHTFPGCLQTLHHLHYGLHGKLLINTASDTAVCQSSKSSPLSLISMRLHSTADQAISGEPKHTSTSVNKQVTPYSSPNAITGFHLNLCKSKHVNEQTVLADFPINISLL